MAMSHSVQDGRDAAARARSTRNSKPRPIRYDIDTWLLMRDDPVLPAAIIVRLRGPGSQEFFVAVCWDLDHEKRRMIGRYATLQNADAAVLYEHSTPIVPRPDEELEAYRQRQEREAVEIERAHADRAKRYRP
jgi:hypothetical protein